MKAKTPHQLLDKWKRKVSEAGLMMGLLFIAVLTACYFGDVLSLPTTLMAGVLGGGSIYWLYKKIVPNLKETLELSHSQNDK